MKFSLDKKWLWWVGYFLLIVVKRFEWGEWILYWILGGAAAYFFDWVDRIVWVYVLQPQAQLAVAVQELVKHSQWRRAATLIREQQGEMQRLVGTSILFYMVWLPLAVFMLTSSQSWFGKGLVMGIGLHGVMLVANHWEDRAWLQQHLFWQIKRPVPWSEMRWWLGVFLVGFVGLSLLV